MSIPNLKKVNLDHLQKPKTLIVIHYRLKRVSIPIFQSIDNITQYLWHQLHKFQTSILDKQQKNKNGKYIHDINDIVGFTSYDQIGNQSDIRMDIVLSMSRLYRDYGKSRSDVKLLDITNYYKYLEIEPYYATNRENQLFPQYHLYTVLSTSDYCTVYLARKISDGRFCSIKICRSDTKLSQNQYNSMKILHHQQQKFQHKDDLQLIPQILEVRKSQGLYIYIYQYCPGGSLRYTLQKKIKEIQCLHYMKQLVWGIHTLHTKFNLIHRALCFQNIQVDFVGNLRLTNFAYCQPCFSSNYSMNYNIPQSYQQKYQIPNILIPPQVQLDYYGIGVVLSEMFTEQHTRQFFTKKQKQGIQIAIDNFMAENIKQRQIFCTEVIAELQQQKINRHSNQTCISENLQHERLTINKLYIGQPINIQQVPPNGIKHEQIIKLMKSSNSDQSYMLNPVKKIKIKNKSKSKSKNKSLSKNKSKSKSKIQAKQSSYECSTYNRHPKNNDKLLNKSIDSKGNSIKSGKSKNSTSKNKTKISLTGSSNQHLSPSQQNKNLTPKNNINIPIKSSTKNSNHKSNNNNNLFTNQILYNKNKIQY